MTTHDGKPEGTLLQRQELGWIVRAFLAHPNRLEKGATAEEVTAVVNWAGNLKAEMLVKMNILYETYMGNIVLDLHQDGEVYMTSMPQGVANSPRDPEQFLSFEALRKL